MTEKYKLLPEHAAQFGPWVKKWVDNSFSVKKMDIEDKKKSIAAINGMYLAAKLEVPKNIVFVPSPFVLRFASGFASAKISQDKNVVVSNHDKLEDIVGKDIWEITQTAVSQATGAKFSSERKTVKKKSVDTDVYFNFPVVEMVDLAYTLFGDSYDFALKCAADSFSMYNGGNQWSSSCSFLSFFKDIVGLKLKEYEAYQHWEDLCVHSGPRIVHADFCMVSDRPEVLKIDANNLAHCETGPFCRWRDGSELYAIHGVYIPRSVVMHPDLQTIDQIKLEKNEEVRRIRIERFGWERFLKESGSKLVESRKNDRDAQQECLYLLDDGTKRFVCVDPSTGRRYALGVPSEIETCEQAQLWMSHGLDLYATHRS